MTMEPRDPSLAALARATVRVADGSGVVIRNGSSALVATAAHVVRGADVATIRRGQTFGDGAVIARDEAMDVALLTPPRDLETPALDLADEESAGRSGDPVWAAGFPRGWKGPGPLVAQGTVAGIGDESWVNLDGTWGQSGGPLCRLSGGSALVVGLLLGAGGDPSQRFEEFEDIMKEAREFGLRFYDLSEQLQQGTADDAVENASRDAVALQLATASLSFRYATLNLELLRDHFRTGFLRFAPVAVLRNLLGPGDVRPAS